MADEIISPIAKDAPQLPLVNTSLPALNSEPVELDSTPVSPESKQHDSLSGATSAGRGGAGASGARKGGDATKRRDDQGVITDVPSEPSAEEYNELADELGKRGQDNGVVDPTT